MISSAKLHKAQDTLSVFSSYKRKINSVFFDFAASNPEIRIPFVEVRKQVKSVAIVSFSSNSGLCGSFNTNVVKKTADLIKSYPETVEITLYAIGKKIYDAFVGNKRIKLKNTYSELVDAPAYSSIVPVADELIASFLSGEKDEIRMIFNKFKNILTQNVTEETLLPMQTATTKNRKTANSETDYIIEPDKISLINLLAPQTIRLSLFEKLLQSATAEHGARSAAMQAATDNAKDLITDLSLEYNKVRQASITGEILDIVGGAEALKG